MSGSKQRLFSLFVFFLSIIFLKNTPLFAAAQVRNLSITPACYTAGQIITVSFEANATNAYQGIMADIVFSDNSIPEYTDDCVLSDAGTNNPPVTTGNNGLYLLNQGGDISVWHKESFPVTVPSGYAGTKYVIVNAAENYMQLWSWGSHIEASTYIVIVPCDNPASVTYTPTYTYTATPTVTKTITQTSTRTFSATQTLTCTNTITSTPTITISETATSTVSITLTQTPTPTLTITLTSTITFTATISETITQTGTPTNTPITYGIAKVRNLTVSGGCYTAGQSMTVSFEVHADILNTYSKFGIFGDILFSNDNVADYNDDCVLEDSGAQDPPDIDGHSGRLIAVQ
jgi:hypothetical protein